MNERRVDDRFRDEELLSTPFRVLFPFVYFSWIAQADRIRMLKRRDGLYDGLRVD